MAENRSKSDGFMLRFPAGLRDKLKSIAERHGRSMNAEIIAILERATSFEEEYGSIEDIIKNIWSDIEDLQREVSDHDRHLFPMRYQRD